MNTNVRKGLLIAVLVIIASAFFYDRFVIKRQRDRILANLMEFADDMSQTYTEKDIQELIGFDGRVTSESQYQKTVQYSWRGLSWRAHELFVQFRKLRQTTILAEVSLEKRDPFSPLIERVAAGSTRDTANIGVVPVKMDVPK